MFALFVFFVYRSCLGMHDTARNRRDPRFSGRFRAIQPQILTFFFSLKL